MKLSCISVAILLKKTAFAHATAAIVSPPDDVTSTYLIEAFTDR